MEKQIIGRGVLAGLIAGALAFIWARVMIEPIINRAIEFEAGTAAAHQALESASAGGHGHGGGGHGGGGHGHGHGEGAELFTRTVQSGLGLGVGVVLFSIALAALAAVVFCVVYPRVALSARSLAMLVSAGMLVALSLVPALKYPPSPPATSVDETIRERAFLYLLMVVISGVLFVGAIVCGHKVAEKYGTWNGVLAGVADYLVTVGIAMALLPGVHEVPGPLRDDTGHIVFEGFPAEDLYDFRLYAMGLQVIVWVTIGVVFSALLHRLLDSREKQALSA